MAAVLNISCAVECGKGQELKGDDCQPCKPGFVNPIPGAACLPCEPGFFSPGASSNCSLCPEGTFTNSSATVECVHCPKTGFQPQLGQVSCLSCGINMEAPFKGSNHEDHCACKPGTFNSSSGTCLTCPPGASCSGGSAQPLPLETFWASAEEPLVFYLCSRSGCGAPPGECRAGYYGRLCAMCSDGYFAVPRGCRKCGGDASLLYAVFFAGSGLFLLLLFILYKTRWYTYFSAFVIGRAVFFFQITSQLPRSGFHSPVDDVQSAGSVTLLNLEGWGVECFVPPLTFEVSNLLMVLIPLVLILLLLAIACFLDKVKSSSVYTQHMPWVAYNIMSFTFLPVSRVVFKVFNCYPQPYLDISTLETENSIDCYSSKWNRVLAFLVPGFVFYVLGFPILNWWVSRNAPHDLKTRAFRNRWGFLFLQQRSKAFNFCLIFTLRKLVLSIVLNVFAERMRLVLGLLTIFSALIYQIGYKPFRFNRDNLLECFVLAALNIMLMASVAGTNFSEIPDSVFATAVGSFTSFVFVVTFLFWMLKDIKRMRKGEHHDNMSDYMGVHTFDDPGREAFELNPVDRLLPKVGLHEIKREFVELFQNKEHLQNTIESWFYHTSHRDQKMLRHVTHELTNQLHLVQIHGMESLVALHQRKSSLMFDSIQQEKMLGGVPIENKAKKKFSESPVEKAVEPGPLFPVTISDEEEPLQVEAEEPVQVEAEDLAREQREQHETHEHLAYVGPADQQHNSPKLTSRIWQPASPSPDPDLQQQHMTYAGDSEAVYVPSAVTTSNQNPAEHPDLHSLNPASSFEPTYQARNFETTKTGPALPFASTTSPPREMVFAQSCDTYGAPQPNSSHTFSSSRPDPPAAPLHPHPHRPYSRPVAQYPASNLQNQHYPYNGALPTLSNATSLQQAEYNSRLATLKALEQQNQLQAKMYLQKQQQMRLQQEYRQMRTHGAATMGFPPPPTAASPVTDARGSEAELYGFVPTRDSEAELYVPPLTAERSHRTFGLSALVSAAQHRVNTIKRDFKQPEPIDFLADIDPSEMSD